jgi:cytochrome c oxidase subunit I+III
MIVPTFARTPIVGYSWIVLAAVGTGFLSFGLWVHHMFTTGLPGISLAFFSAASQAVAIPTGVQFFCFLATLLVGRVVTSVPILFVIGGLATFVLGGLTGVMVAMAPFDFQAHDTFFVVGHLHTVLIGGTVFPIFAGLYYFFPLVAARKLSERLGRIAFWLMLVGFNVTFLPMHLTGMRGMVRRGFTYPAGIGFDGLNLVSSVGAFILAAGILIVLWDVVRPKRREPYSERNPWKAGTIEWLTEMPSPPWGVRSIPEIDSRYPLWDQKNFMRDVDEGRFYLPDAEEYRRETIVTTAVDAEPVQCLRLGGNTFLPLLSAVFTGGIFIFSTFHWWWLALVSGVFALASILTWLWTGTAEIPEKPDKNVGLGLTLPIYVSGPSSVGWWGMLITMLGVVTAFMSLVFGYFFYWTARPDFPPQPTTAPGVWWPSVALALTLSAWFLTILARRWNRDDASAWFYVAIALAVLMAGAGGAALMAGPWVTRLDPQSHVYGAIVWTLVIWTAAHAALGMIMHAYCAARRLAGRMTARHDQDIVNVTLYWHFVAFTAVVTVAVIAGFPLLT